MTTSPLSDSTPIFISYRREDSKDSAMRLHDDLEFVFGKQSAFIDLSRISPGKKWSDVLRDRLEAAEVVLVIIGRNCVKIADQVPYQRRLDTENDWVRIEIEEALRLDRVIIPVLVGGATMPKPAQLPSSIAGLSSRQSVAISGENLKRGLAELVEALGEHGLTSVADLAGRPVRPEPSMIGVLDYFYRRIGQAASGSRDRRAPAKHIVACTGLGDLWQFIEDFNLQQTPIEEAPTIRVPGQLSTYAPLLYGNPMHKRNLHLELRKGAVQLIEELGYEFGELLNGLMSYSAGQMVIRPHFRTKYVFLGLYESIVRNSIPVMVERQYFEARVAPLFRQFNVLDVSVSGYLAEIPNYTKDALDDFGLTDRLGPILGEQTLEKVGDPNYALFVDGDEETFIEVPESSDQHPKSARYLDGDIWVANSSNSIISRFINISSREDMLNSVTQIQQELHASSHGRGVVSSFDIRLAEIDDTIPDRILSSDQLKD